VVRSCGAAGTGKLRRRDRNGCRFEPKDPCPVVARRGQRV
jgi:hypothetical protein